MVFSCRYGLEVRGIVLFLCEDVAELVVHGVEIPVVQVQRQFRVVAVRVILVYVDVLKVKLIDPEQCNLDSAFCRTEGDGALAVVLRGADELENPESVLPDEIRSCAFDICVKPYMLDEDGDCL